MSLSRLIPDPNQTPAPFDVQETAMTHDVFGRYVCNTWAEVDASQKNGGYPFDAVVIGSGMYGAYCAEELYRLGAPLGLRILVLDAGGFLLPSHIQNLPQQLGGSIGGSPLRQGDNGTQNVVWGMPWISNVGFPGLAYCLGGRSLFWGGWSPRLTADDLAQWPAEVAAFLQSSPSQLCDPDPNVAAPDAYCETEREIGVVPSTDYIIQTELYQTLVNAFSAARANVSAITEVREAPLAVQGTSPKSGILPFDKFSSCPFLIDAVRDDVAVNTSHGDVSRRIFLLPRTQVLRLNAPGGVVTSLDLSVDGQNQTLAVNPNCAIVIANGTIEATRLALNSLGIGSTQFGSPRVGNLMAHLRSNITVRIKRSALGLSTPKDLETVALLVRGTASGRRFHLQVTAASVVGANPEKNLFCLVPDIDLLENMLANQDPAWVVITLRGIGEMEDQRSLNPNPAMSWIDLSQETDRWGIRRAYVNLVKTLNDGALWTAMDDAAFALARQIAKSPANIEYWNSAMNQWQSAQPQPDAVGNGFWRDGLGTTHHEAGPLFMGTLGNSITDLNGKFHNVANAYVAGPAVFPTLGSANPSLTALSLTRRTAGAIIQKASPVADPGFAALSLDPKDWQMVRSAPTDNVGVRHYGQVLETFGGYGLYWYIKEQFSNFLLKLEWRVGRRDDNSGVYIRIPAPSVLNPLQAADNQGHEIQIDERGYDSLTNTEGHPEKRTGAIYNLQAPTAFPSNPIGDWNTYAIEANGPQIKVTLNGQVVNVYQSNRQTFGFIALQAHYYGSRVQFRNLLIKKLP